MVVIEREFCEHRVIQVISQILEFDAPFTLRYTLKSKTELETIKRIEIHSTIS